MVAAAAAQRGYENSKRRSRAAWTEARQRARQRADEREKAARERAEGRRRWFHQARRNPAHPVSWGYGFGWGVAAAGAGAVAGARGARDGARAGAREGANVGRRAAREGWGLGTAWAEYRRQRDADRDQHARAQGESRQAGASADGSEPDPPPVWVSCRGCAAAITPARAHEADGLCPDCFDPNPQAAASGGTEAGEPRGDIYEAVVLEDLPTCPRCARPVEEPHDCATGSEGGHGSDSTDDVTEHDNNDDNADRKGLPMSHQAISVNGAGISGGDGEGYAGTVSALEQMGHLLDEAQQVITDLNDQVTAKNVDAETISGLSALADHVQAGAAQAGATLAHVQSKHNEVAAAVSGAGGSQEVADTDWYDQY